MSDDQEPPTDARFSSSPSFHLRIFIQMASSSSAPAAMRRRRVEMAAEEAAAALVVPARPYRPLHDHPWLHYAMDSEDYARLQFVIAQRFVQMRAIDWDFLEALGARQRAMDVLTAPWRRLLDITLLTYTELCYELYSTFIFHDTGVGLDLGGAIEFRLGGLEHALSVRRFARNLGIYIEEELQQPIFTKSIIRSDSLRSVGHPLGMGHTLRPSELPRFETCSSATSTGSLLRQYQLGLRARSESHSFTRSSYSAYFAGSTVMWSWPSPHTFTHMGAGRAPVILVAARTSPD